MNISGIVVVTPPARLRETIEALRGLPGVQVYHQDAPSGRIVVTQEAPDIDAEVQGLRLIKALPGVTMAEMVYHHFEEDQGEFTGLPEELPGDEPRLRVPASLRDAD